MSKGNLCCGPWEASEASHCVRSMGSERSEPLRARDGKPSAGARTKGAQRPEILVCQKNKVTPPLQPSDICVRNVFATWGLDLKKQVRGTTRCVMISMKYYALTGWERFCGNCYIAQVLICRDRKCLEYLVLVQVKVSIGIDGFQRPRQPSYHFNWGLNDHLIYQKFSLFLPTFQPLLSTLSMSIKHTPYTWTQRRWGYRV